MSEIKNTNVAVIGGAGFLGSHLVDHLIQDRNCNVVVLDNLISGLRKHVHPKAKFVWFDIRGDEKELSKILKDNGVKFVFNYAAEPYIPKSFEMPMHVFEINATAVLKVLNASQDAGVERILQVSSAEIYGKANGQINEDEPIEAHSTYGVAKMAADGIVQTAWKERKTPAIAMRQFNCVGERETHEYVIPEIIQQLAKGNVCKLGNNSVRDFQYAGDAVRMAVELLEKGELGEVYNMGSEDSIHIYELAELISELMDIKGFILETEDARRRPWEIWHLQSDNTKLYKSIGTEWREKRTPLKVALQKTIDYFYDNGEKWDF